MKALQYLSLFLCIGLAIRAQAQQITLKGQVSIHNSKYLTGTLQYVENAEVSADSASPTSSDRQGQYQLEFIGLKEGTTVDVNVAKVNLEVVNEHDLQNVTIGRRSGLKIFLAPLGHLAQARTELYDISLKVLTKKHHQLINQLRKGGEESQKALTELQEKFNREIKNRFEAEGILNKQFEASKERLPETLKKLAEVNLDFATEQYREAYEFYKNGEVEKAIEKLGIQDLEIIAKGAVDNIKQLDSELDNYLLLREQERERLGQIVHSYRLKANAYNLLFEYRKAANVYEKAIKLLELLKDKPDFEISVAYREIGVIYHDLGEYQKSKFYKEKDLQICKSILESTDINLITSYNNLALLYKALGDYETSLKFQRQAVISLEKRIDEGLLSDFGVTATLYNNLAMIHSSLKNHEKALESQHKAILYRQKIIESGYEIELARYLNNLSTIFYDLGDYEKALDSQEKAIELRIKILPSNHPDLAESYNNLALYYNELEQPNQALIFLEKAGSIWEKVLEPNHPTLSTYYNNLSEIYESLEKYEEAIFFLSKDLEIGKSIFDVDHPFLLDTYQDLIWLYDLNGEIEQAIRIKLSAIESLKDNVQPNHPFLQDLLCYNDARINANLGLNIGLEEVLDFLLIESDMLNDEIRTFHPYRLKFNGLLSSIYTKLEKYHDAAKVLINSLPVVQHLFGPDNPNLAAYNTRLANIFYLQDELDDAIYYQSSAHIIWEKNLPATYTNLEDSKELLGMLYGKRGKKHLENKKPRAAIEDYLKALEFQPQNDEFKQKIEYIKQGK